MNSPFITSQEFLAAYEAHADSIFRHCYFRTGDRELGKDLMQETFLKAWEYIASGKKVENLRAFLYKTANNIIIDTYRKKKEGVQSLDTMMEAGFDISSEEDTTKKAEKGFTEHYVRRILGKISEPYRSAVMMRYLDELSPADIAEALGVSANVASVRINRGVDRLRTLLQNNEQ